MVLRKPHFGFLLFGVLLLAGGSAYFWQELADDTFRDEAVVLDATFSKMECKGTEDPSCMIDVVYQPPQGEPVQQRIRIEYDYAYCSSTPAFHMDGVEAKLYMHPQTPKDAVLGRNPCELGSPLFRAAWFWGFGLLMVVVALWAGEPWRRA